MILVFRKLNVFFFMTSMIFRYKTIKIFVVCFSLKYIALVTYLRTPISNIELKLPRMHCAKIAHNNISKVFIFKGITQQ